MTTQDADGIVAVMDRVAKLLRLAGSDNPHEAAAAAARAQELMARYAIDQATIELDAPPEARESIADFSESDPLETAAHVFPRWKLSLLAALCHANQAVATLTRTPSGRRIGVIGRPSDVAKVRYMYAWLVSEITALSATAGKGQGRSWANSFRVGFVHGLAIQLRDATAKAQAEARAAADSSTALVRVDRAIERIAAREREVDDWMKQHRGHMKNTRTNARVNVDDWAHLEGQQAGADFNLSARARIGAVP